MSAAMLLPEAGLSLDAVVREMGRAGIRSTGSLGVSVSDVRQDSRRVRAGDLFVARSGARVDGARFVHDAVRAGAVAILAEEGAALPAVSVPVLWAREVRLALALAAEAVHGHPARALEMVGITGTNGKTTTAFLARQAIDGAGRAAARLGTLGYAFRDDVVDESLTTPEADELSRFAARARSRGATHLVMEVSSIAVVQQRVAAVPFAVAAFTNLTQDHLDFHGSMDAYGAAKERLFTDLSPRVSVLHVGDAFGEALARRARGRVIRVGRTEGCEIRALSARTDAAGIHARLSTPAGEVELESRLVGAHNLENLLVALGIVEGLGLDVGRAAASLARAAGAPGRLERCDEPDDDVTVLVDYAHTPDALRRVLEAVRSLGAGAVCCVFGCGGDRDPGKRPLMGAAVGAAADRAVLTSDNPRTEDPAAIARAVEPALSASGIRYDVELDRRAAIERAILEAEPGDLVLLAGKGHEPYQLVGEESRTFDDRVEARRALRLRRVGRS